MSKLKIFLVLFVTYFSLDSMSLSMDTVSSSKEKEIEKVLNQSFLTELIVGCGEKPYAWQSASKEQGQVNLWEQDPDQGNHQHKDCLTLAESDAVKPHIIWDWTIPVPKSMHNRFTHIYLEKLPPIVLEHENCMKNLWLCLQPQGIGIFDHQLRTTAGYEYALVTSFTLTIPPAPQEVLKEIAWLEHLGTIARSEFNKISHTDPTTPMTPDEFEQLLLGDSELEILNQIMYDYNQKKSQLRIKTMNEQNAIAYQKLRGAANEKVIQHMESFGFGNVDLKVGKNPFNQRQNSTLVYVKK